MSMMPKSMKRFSVNMMRGIKMMSKSIKRFSDNIVRWKKGYA
jgi:hypothetical protein